MLVDTGSNRTIIRSNIFNFNEKTNKLNKCSQRVQTANGQQSEILGKL